jgi:hypothetical protein
MNLPDRFDIYSLGLIFLQMVSMAIEPKFCLQLLHFLCTSFYRLNELLPCLPEERNIISIIAAVLYFRLNRDRWDVRVFCLIFLKNKWLNGFHGDVFCALLGIIWNIVSVL